ncbi:862896fa-b508-4ee6-aaf4-257623ec1f2c [Thermothielavioides terrestris]|uniref:non-specific serine/threonine protein kinase n=1 Tax=Thermothielavioides terrestris TaxID=2587410 RepID=A0A3S4F4V5_9PEZI|nr:862896fa-b508-4ee6-aaf4-257623ec1f2c [Thermothielavioides terrestris]
MSLVPYRRREQLDIVLRHANAIVFRDPSSQQLEIQDLQHLNECPTCHQPLPSSSSDRHYDNTDHDESYHHPDYFRMLAASHAAHNESHTRPPPSPIRRLVQPVRAGDEDDRADAEFASGSAAPSRGARIKPEAFSPNYLRDYFIVERELGRGGKGVVLLLRHRLGDCKLGQFACKRVPVGDDPAWLEKVLVEVQLLAKLSHHNLVSYRYAWLEEAQLTRFGPSVACLFILQQYCNGGDLLHYVIGEMPTEATKEQLKAQMRRRSKGQTERPKIQKRLAPDEIYSLFKDITSGLVYLHGENYIHRDLKPSNCLLHHDRNKLRCLISDFGEVQQEDAVQVLKQDASGRYGNFTTKSDIFSLGLILYFMCFGRLPYVNANIVREELEDVDELRAEISDWKGFQDERRERPDLPSELYGLLKRLLAVNPSERPTAKEVLAAMGADSSLDGMMRAAAKAGSPFLGLSGQRIQNLDSPMPPSTPVAEPTKHARANSSPEDDLARPFNHTAAETSANPSSSTILTKRISPPLASSHAMTLSRSHRGSGSGSHSHSPGRATSRSPQRSPHTHQASSATADGPAIVTTPLLMAPPMSPLQRARRAAALAWYRAPEWVAAHAGLLRTALFTLKVLSLSWVCWPYSAKWEIMAGLR